MRNIKTPIKVQWKFSELARMIKTYESDTFSASILKLTDKQAIAIASRLVVDDIQARIDLETLDGLMLDEKYDLVKRLK